MAEVLQNFKILAKRHFIAQLTEVRKIKPDILFIPGFHQQVGVILREAKRFTNKS